MPGFSWLVDFSDDDRIATLAAIVPALLFAALEGVVLWYVGTITTLVTAVTLALGAALVVLGFVMMRLFTEARRFRTQIKIEQKRNLTS